MDIIKAILTHIQKPETPETAPQGLCPVCWGYQQYDKQIRTLFKDKQIDINNHKDSYMLIQDFMKHRLDGVKLKEGVVSDCPNCLDRR